MSQHSSAAAQCLHHVERPQTPERIQKYRRGFHAQPGKRVTHWGMVEDTAALRERLSEQRLGERSSTSSGSVVDAFKGGRTGTLADYVEEKKESIYRTHKEEPLGKPYTRGHDYSGLSMDATRLKRDAVSAKELIYSSNKRLGKGKGKGKVGEGADADTDADWDAEEERVRRQYLKSHNRFAPGEQRDRSYNWKQIDPKEHRFGAVGTSQDASDGVAVCLQPETLQERAKELPLAVANHRAMTMDVLGKPKYRGNVGSESIRRLEERQRQARNARAPVFSAQQCIAGEYSASDQLPDHDLGRAVRPGWRNETSSDRRFGCPTVRIDVQPPTTRSVSDNQNYGDDTNAAKLLYPSPFVVQGVDDADYVDATDPCTIRDVMLRVGHDFTDADFDKIHSRACLVNGRVDAVGIQQFLAVVNDRLRALDEGGEPLWW